MKIVIDGRIIPTSSGRYIVRMLDGLQEIDQKNEYVVLVREEGDWEPTADNFHADVAAVPDFSFGEQFKLNSIIRSHNPDLVHYPMPQHPLLTPKPFVVTLQDFTLFDYPDKTGKFWKFLIKMPVFRFVVWMALKRSAHIIALTNYGRRDILDRYRIDEGKITSIYEAGEAIAEQSTPYAEREKITGPYIMYVGRAMHHKNIPRLIKAHQQLLDKHPGLQLLLVGKIADEHRRLQQLVKDEGYKNIVFTGFVPDDELSWLYSHAEAYIFPSLSEGFGLPALEAMHHDCPVVSSNATCLPEVYGSAAQYFDPLNVDDMTKTINSVLCDDQLRQNMVEAGRQQAAKYSWHKTARQTLSVYRKVIIND